MPRTFQGRLTVAFVAVIALTLFLVTVLVLNRLDDYFTDQQNADLKVRSDAVGAVRQSCRPSSQPPDAPVVGLDNEVNPVVADGSWPTRASSTSSPTSSGRPTSSDRLRPADPERRELDVRAGGRTAPSSPRSAVAPTNGPDARGDLGRPRTRSRGGSVWSPYAVEVTLSNPYTFRAPGHRQRHRAARRRRARSPSACRVVVSAWLARRFTTPLRQLTDAARGLAEGDLARRVPMRQVRSGSSEIAELAVQFNAMADRLEESVEIIRRDRDREPRLPGRRLARAAHAARRAADVQRAAQAGRPATTRKRAPSSSSRAASRSTGSTGSPRTCSSSRSSTRGWSCSTCARTTCGRRSRSPAEQTSAAATEARRPPRPPPAATRRSGSATTRSGSARSSPTSSATRSSSRRAAGRSRRPRARPPTARGSTWPTRASASTRPSCRTSSSASTAGRGRTRRAAAAAGSGLAIVRSIVDMHGGRSWSRAASERADVHRRAAARPAARSAGDARAAERAGGRRRRTRARAPGGRAAT